MGEGAGVGDCTTATVGPSRRRFATYDVLALVQAVKDFDWSAGRRWDGGLLSIIFVHNWHRPI